MPTSTYAEYEIAAAEFVQKLFRLNLTEKRAGLTKLEDQDRTWHWWAKELEKRASVLDQFQEPPVDMVLALGACVVALQTRLMRHHAAQSHTGEAA